MKTRRLAAIAITAMALSLVAAPSALAYFTSEPHSFSYQITSADHFPGECEELTLTTASVEENGGTTFTYTLSGGGEGPEEECLEHAVSNISIPIGECYSPAMGGGGDVVREMHPNGWTYSPKNSTKGKLDGKRIKWDVLNSDQDGWGPFDDLRFSVTFADTGYSTVEAPAYLFAANVETQIGTVLVSECEPEPQEAESFGGAGIQSTGSTEPDAPTATPTPEPTAAPAEETTGEDGRGGENRDDGGDTGETEEQPTAEPTATPTPETPTPTPEPRPKPTATPQPKPEPRGITDDGSTFHGYADLPD